MDHINGREWKFDDRAAAGRALAPAVRRLALPPPLLVLALPRGGVPVACEVAEALAAPLDVLIVRKLGHPQQPELAIGAIASGGVLVHEPQVEWELPVSAETFAGIVARERRELARREHLYRSGQAPLDMRGRTVVLIDDGIATGATMLAAARAAHQGRAARVVVAAPVAAPTAVAVLRTTADDVVVLETPAFFQAIGQWYGNFAQLADATVIELLERARRRAPRMTPTGTAPAADPH
jgi:putative phosphoribosyl transferase